MRTFKAYGTYYITEHGTVYLGFSPFRFQRERALEAFSGEWQIDHPDTIGKVYRVKAIECHCVLTIRAADPIGLMVDRKSVV